jgi:hypothetical protein
MKNKILGDIAVLAIAAVAVINVDLGTKRNDLSAISLANVEALAQEGGGSPCSGCEVVWGSICWSSGLDGCIGYPKTVIYC